MFSQSNPTSETLPRHLQALLDLTREAEPPSMASWLRDYRAAILLCLCYSFLAFFQTSSSSSAPILFFGAISVMFSLHQVSERRARERWKLLLEGLRHQSLGDVNSSNQVA